MGELSISRLSITLLKKLQLKMSKAGVLQFKGSNVTPRFGRSTRGNRRVPLNGSQFPEIQPKARKTSDILTRLKNGYPIRPNLILKL